MKTLEVKCWGWRRGSGGSAWAIRGCCEMPQWALSIIELLKQQQIDSVAELKLDNKQQINNQINELKWLKYKLIYNVVEELITKQLQSKTEKFDLKISIRGGKWINIIANKYVDWGFWIQKFSGRTKFNWGSVWM